MIPRIQTSPLFVGNYRKRLLIFLLSLIIFSGLPFPAQSQSVAACASNPVCAAELGLAKAALAPSATGAAATNPFALGVAGSSVPLAAAALAYLNPADWSNLRDRTASSIADLHVTGTNIVVAYGSGCVKSFDNPDLVRWTITSTGYTTTNSSSAGSNWSDALSCGNPNNPSQGLPDSQILTAAAASAAAAAAAALPDASSPDSSLRNSAVSAAAAAAAAAQQASDLIAADPSSSSSDIAAAAASASAAGSSAAAAAAAAAQAQADFPPSDYSQPNITAIAPATGYTSSTNWLSHGVAVLSTKFPFDIFTVPTGGTSNLCPEYQFFTKTYQFCMIRDLVGFLRIPTIISFLIWSVMTV